MTLAKFRLYQGNPIVKASMLNIDSPSPQMCVEFLHSQKDGTAVVLSEIIKWEEFDQLPFKIYKLQETEIDPDTINNTV